MLLALNALAKRRDAQSPAAAHDVFHQRTGLVVVPVIAEEYQIELQNVKVIFRNGVQRGIPAAEIVQPDVITQILHLLALAFDVADIVVQSAFGDLQIDHIAREAVFGACFFHNAEDIAKLKIQPRYIDRNRYDRLPRIVQLAVILADLADDVGIDQMNQVELFQRFNEVDRPEHSDLRVDPAHQCLVAADLARADAHHRLIKDLNVFLRNGLVNVIDHILLLAQTLAEHLVIDAVVDIVAVLDALAGKPRVIAGKSDFRIAVVEKIDARLDAHLHADIFRQQQIPVYLFYVLNDLIPLAGCTDEEMVVREACGRAAAECLADDLCRVDEQLVTLFEAVPFVIELEIRDIKLNDGEFLAAVFRRAEQLLHTEIEKRHIEQTGQRIDLLIAGKQRCLGKGIAVCVGIFVPVHIHDEDIEIAFAVLAVQQMPEILDIPDLALFGADAVAHIIVPLFDEERLCLDLVFDLVQIVRMHHAPERSADILHEFFKGFAAEQADNILLCKEDLFFPLRLVDEESAGQPDRDRAAACRLDIILSHGGSFLSGSILPQFTPIPMR